MTLDKHDCDCIAEVLTWVIIASCGAFVFYLGGAPALLAWLISTLVQSTHNNLT